MASKKYLPWLFSVIAALVLFFICAFSDGLFRADSSKDVLRILSDCFTVSGGVLLGVSLLSWISTFGQFDILSYGSRSFLGHFIPSLSRDLPSKFYEYKKEKDDKGRSWLKRTCVVGLVSILFSVIFLVLFYCV